ncbi:Methyltransferase-like protein 22 [Quaeritorhiza haematococci]|nr:Methyltransferase-like protein 22 [Quaeritorhiza haematococci]
MDCSMITSKLKVSANDNNPDDNDNNPTDDDIYLSEIHCIPSKIPPRSSSLQTTTFNAHIGSPPSPATLLSLTLHHRLATPLTHVGLQIWPGSLLLADFLLHLSLSAPESLLRGRTVLELGCGAGLVSVLCGGAVVGCEKVFATDVGLGVGERVNDKCTEAEEVSSGESGDWNVLDLCAHNVKVNGVDKRVLVRELDLLTDLTWLTKKAPETDDKHSTTTTTTPDMTPYAWTPTDIEHFRTSCDTILAADIIYDPALSFALASRLYDLLDAGEDKEPRTMYLALEKRIVFTVEEGRGVCAPARDYFLETLEALHAQRAEGLTMEGDIKCPSELRIKCKEWKEVRYEKIDVESLPQYFEYERSKYLELWKFEIGQGQLG